MRGGKEYGQQCRHQTLAIERRFSIRITFRCEKFGTLSNAVVIKQEERLIPLISIELFRKEGLDDAVVETHPDVSNGTGRGVRITPNVHIGGNEH